MTSSNETKPLTRRQRRLAKQAAEERRQATGSANTDPGTAGTPYVTGGLTSTTTLYVEPGFEIGGTGFYALVRHSNGDISTIPTSVTGGGQELASRVASYARAGGYNRILVLSNGLGQAVANWIRQEAPPSIVVDNEYGPSRLDSSTSRDTDYTHAEPPEQTVPTVGGWIPPLLSVEEATEAADKALRKVYGTPEKASTELPGLEILEQTLAELHDDLEELVDEPEADPNQYYHLSNGIEAKDVAGELVYNAGTAFTYMFRSCRTDGVVKGDPESDINKAIDHLLFELERRGFERKGVAGA